jgi:hypothetical protein
VQFKTIYGVDFSGAKNAGRTIWIARARSSRGRRLVLEELVNLERASGHAAREPALAWLVGQIAASCDALWAIDFPFGLPTAVMDPGASWRDLLRAVASWPQDAYDFGLQCLARAKAGGPAHVYRPTDRQTKAPFSCYHYRIIYQTFHGMRDVLLPLLRQKGTAIVPFQYRKLPGARRVVVEACPSSTLKRLRLPHQNYKQPEGGSLSGKRRRTRHAILSGLEPLITIDSPDRRRIMRDGGGDALDAVLAAVGAAHAWQATDHAVVARDRRACREGRIYA